MDFDAEHKTLTWQEDSEKNPSAEKLDGGYVLKTDRQDLTAEEIWRTYILLRRGGWRQPSGDEESRYWSGPSSTIWKSARKTHIFLCVLAYICCGHPRSASLDRGVAHLLVDPARTTAHAPGSPRWCCRPRRERC